jgi:hypothetical protein
VILVRPPAFGYAILFDSSVSVGGFAIADPTTPSALIRLGRGICYRST